MKLFLHLTKTEEKVLRTLNSPSKIQDYLDTLSFNYEKNGETCMSPRRVICEKKAHCIEGALLAACALWIHGETPYIVNLKVEEKVGDFDHVVTLFKRNGYWGAISKTNHGVLRWRDPVYKTMRELVMSYFHEYFLVSNGKKTLRGYSQKINVKRFGTKWITEEKDLWDIASTIFDLPHIPVIPKENKKYIRTASAIEKKVASIPEWNT